MQTVINSCLINYEVLGKKNKDLIFILHGWGRNLNDWQAIAHRLADKYKVYLLDIPGHGASGMPPKQPFDTYDYAQIVESYINRFTTNKAVLLGHSFGGKISVVVASRSKKVNKLILVDASGVDEKNTFTRFQIFFYRHIKLFLRLLPRKTYNRIHKRIYKQAGDLVDSFKKIVIQNVDKEARMINIPTVIIWGENDSEVTTDQGKKYRELINNSILRIVWGTNHHPHLEKPDKFYSLLSEYL